MLDIIIVLTLIVIVSLIFTLKKGSKVRKFLIIFISIVSILTGGLSLIIYLQNIQSNNENEKNRLISINEANNWRASIENLVSNNKLQIEFNIKYPENSYPTFQIVTPFFAKVEGRITNTSEINFKTFILRYKIKDCVTKCIIIGEGTEDIALFIPNQQARDFSFLINTNNENIKFKGNPQIEVQIINAYM